MYYTRNWRIENTKEQYGTPIVLGVFTIFPRIAFGFARISAILNETLQKDQLVTFEPLICE